MANDELVSQISEAIASAVASETHELREDLDRVRAQFAAEDYGWKRVFGSNPFDQDTGISLETLKQVSEQLREEVAGSPLPKQANELRHSYTFSQPFIIPGLENSAEVKQGRPSTEEVARRSLKGFYENSTNQRYVFGKEAHRLISTACSTDGLYVVIGNDATKKMYPIPLNEITGVYVNPDFASEIWAYQREWTPNPTATNPESRKRWYFTDRFEGSRPASIGEDNNRVTVEKTWTAIDLSVGQQSGWVLGIPDLMAGQVWNQRYLRMFGHGEEVSATLAFYAAKVKQKSKSGSDNVGLKLRQAGESRGNTVTYAEGNEVDTFSTAKDTYNFDGLRPAAALYAASVGVSVVDLLASPSAAGSSYGSASALTGGVRRGIESRRSLIASWMERVLKWGTGQAITVTPASIEEVEAYRKAQVGILGWNSGLLHEDEVRPFLISVSGMTPKHNSAPDGVLLPNNEKSVQRTDIDTDSHTPATDAAGQNPTTSAPGQGVAQGTGGASSGDRNDLRSDVISQSIMQDIQNEQFLERLESLVTRMENAAK